MSQLGLSDSDPSPQSPVDKPASAPVYAVGSCPDCRNVVSQQAHTCPHCGRPFVHPSQYPSIGRIAAGVIVGYLGILVINFVLAVIIMLFFAGVIGSALSGPAPRPSSSTSRP